MDRYTKYKAAFPNKTDRECIESLSAEVSDKVEAIGNLLSEIAELKNKPSNPASQFCEKAMRFASWISDNGLCSFLNKEGELMFFTNLKSEDDIPCDLVLRQFEDGVTKFRNTKKEDSSK